MQKQSTAQYSQPSAQFSEQAAPTAKTIAKVKQLLDYVSTQKKAIITYRARDMILSVHSNAGYCNKKKT
jgi:hypothetical protein